MKLLEPIMKVEVVRPEDYVGTVIGDLNSRRGMIQGQDMRGNATVINAHGAACQHVRLREQPALRKRRAGRTTRCSSSHYEAVPSAVAKEVIEKLSG